MHHGVCCVNYQNKVGRTDIAMKKKWEKKLKETLQKKTKTTCGIHQETSLFRDHTLSM